MVSPSEKLAASLDVLRKLQDLDVVAIRTGDLTRTHRERLLANGFLLEVMKGWYIPSRPDEATGDSTAWYASFWDFCVAYLRERFGEDWCLSPEQSLSLHAGNRTVPRQLLVRSPKAHNNITALPHDTSLLDARASLPATGEIEEKEGMRLFSKASALISCSAQFFTKNPTDARAVLLTVRDASEVLDRLLEGGHSKIAGRIAGAFRNIGRHRIADDIVKTMRAAGYDVRENDPFEAKSPLIFPGREISPYVNRIRLMWQEMCGLVIERFPKEPERLKDIDAYMERVEEIYVKDAYHSLSIEGYRVSTELIERVRNGAWNPDDNEDNREQRSALAARGYWQAYQSVRESVLRVLQGANSGTVAEEDHSTWYREMFAPGVIAGLLKPADLAGYRNGPVCIRSSMHVPPSREAVPDAILAFFDLLSEETEVSVRIVLGHFIFVFIHPYIDGNGRMGRFLMNLMLAAGGYPWTVIPVEERNAYMAALEEASVQQNIGPFAEFIADLVEKGLQGEPPLKVPGEA